MKVNNPPRMETNLPDFTDLADSEANLLASVAVNAEQKAGMLGEAFFNRILDRFSTDDLVTLQQSREKVENWFINLFRGKGTGISEEESTEFISPTESAVPEAMWVFDLILDYGEEVANTCAKAMQAKSAFHKRVARELAILQRQGSQHQSFLEEMLLMD